MLSVFAMGTPCSWYQILLQLSLAALKPLTQHCGVKQQLFNMLVDFVGLELEKGAAEMALHLL